jgi:hypothetical protein
MLDVIAVLATVVVVGICTGYAIAPAIQEWLWWRRRR